MSDNLYPGISVEIVDGQLLTPISIPADSTLILDVAVKGPTSRLYFVTNAKDAAAIYGATSPLIKQAQKAFDSGTKNILLYRVGGNPAAIESLFSENNGIQTALSAAGADFGLSLYIGPEPLNPALDAVIVYQGSKIVYSNTLSSPVDLAVVTLDTFNKTTNDVFVGSYLSPVPFSSVVAEAGTRTVVSAVGDNELTLPVGYVDANVSTYSRIVKVDSAIIPASGYVIDPIGLTLTISGPAVGPTAVVEYAYVTKFTSGEVTTRGIAYTAGEDLINAGYEALYEAFDTALDDLELVDAKVTVIGDLFSVPNVAYGATTGNYLRYLSISEDEEGEKVYTWSADKILYQSGITTTTDVNDADLTGNGQPIIAQLFNQVDFVHRVGTWAFEKTNEGVFTNVVVGVPAPATYNRKGVSHWVGTSPTYDLNGNIIVNGTGLLGDPLMVGTTAYPGGYFDTDTGFVDGVIQTDSAGAAVDLGKYLSIVVSQVSSSNASIGGTVASGAPYYAGVISQVTPGDSTTNKVVPGIYIATELKDVKLRALSKAGYVVFKTEPQGPTVISGDLATRNVSDYQYIGTSITIAQVIADLKAVGNPFIGRGIDGVSLVSLQTALNRQMMARQTAGYFISYALQMQQIAPNEIQIAFSITAKDELRVISSTVKLARQIFSDINSN